MCIASCLVCKCNAEIWEESRGREAWKGGVEGRRGREAGKQGRGGKEEAKEEKGQKKRGKEAKEEGERGKEGQGRGKEGQGRGKEEARKRQGRGAKKRKKCLLSCTFFIILPSVLMNCIHTPHTLANNLRAGSLRKTTSSTLLWTGRSFY
jgi:hypothetical protein